MERTFDWKPRFDEKSRSFPIRTLIPAGVAPQYKLWHFGPQLDQGSEGACVGFGWAAEAGASPVRVKNITDDFARGIYQEAKRIDEWEGEDYEGTSVLAGAKVMKSRGFITEYRWCFSLNDVLLALSYEGPVVLGLNWYEGMFDTNAKNFITPTGNWVGGHCIMARGISVKYERILLRNSWGKDWGSRGGAYLSFSDLDRLLHESGEACVPVGRKLNGS